MCGGPTWRWPCLLVCACVLFLAAGGAEAQPRPARGGGGGGGDPTTRLPDAPIIGGDLPGQGLGGPNRPENDAPHAPDLLVVVFRPETPETTSSAFADSLDLTIERRFA